MAETAQLARSVLELSGPQDSRTAWDCVWREVLARVLQDEPLPEGTVHHMIPEVQRYLAQVNTQRTLLEEKCESYLQSNRRTGLVYSELWCDAILHDGRRAYLHKKSQGSSQHAEVQAMQHLSQLQDGSRLKSVEMYLNVSPCSACSDAIVRCLGDTPGVRTCLYFSSVYAHHGDNHRQGLRALQRAGVHLAVFDHTHWLRLTQLLLQHDEEQRQAENAANTENTQAHGSKRKLDKDMQPPLPRKRRN